jgi:hypothetical protein
MASLVSLRSRQRLQGNIHGLVLVSIVLCVSLQSTLIEIAENPGTFLSGFRMILERSFDEGFY